MIRLFKKSYYLNSKKNAFCSVPVNVFYRPISFSLVLRLTTTYLFGKLTDIYILPILGNVLFPVEIKFSNDFSYLNFDLNLQYYTRTHTYAYAHLNISVCVSLKETYFFVTSV